MVDQKKALKPLSLCPKGWAWLIPDCSFDGDCDSCHQPDAPIKLRKDRK